MRRFSDGDFGAITHSFSDPSVSGKSQDHSHHFHGCNFLFPSIFIKFWGFLPKDKICFPCNVLILYGISDARGKPHFFMPCTGSGTTLSQGDISGSVKHTPKKESLAKIMALNYV